MLLFDANYHMRSDPAKIAGTINTYARVVGFDGCGVSTVVEEKVENQQGMDLAAVDRVMVIRKTGVVRKSSFIATSFQPELEMQTIPNGS